MNISRFKIPILAACLSLTAIAWTSAGATGVDDYFELDGDTCDGTDNGNHSPCTADMGIPDWEQMYNISGTTTGTTPKADADLPGGFHAATFAADFVKDANGPDTTTFTEGSSDNLPIAQWVCTRANNTGDKVDKVNSGAVAYIVTNPMDPRYGHTLLYVWMERFSNEGDANIAFWMLKDGTVSCESTGGGSVDFSFTDGHIDGDALVSATFTNGGDNINVNVRRWNGDDATGNLSGVGSGGECLAGGNEDICGKVNRHSIRSLWLTQTKQNGPGFSEHTDTAQFFEAGIDLNAEGLGGCFAKFLAATRQSPSPTAALADFNVEQFELCSAKVDKSCSTGVITDNDACTAEDVPFTCCTGLDTGTCGNTIEIPYSVYAVNDGASTIGNISVKDDNCTPSDDTDDETITFTNLANGAPQTVNKTCVFPLGSVTLPVENTLYDLATTSLGVSLSLGGAGGECILDDNENEDPSDDTCAATCDVDTDPMIDVTKQCNTRLVVANGKVNVRVPYNGAVKNTSDGTTAPVPLTNVAAVDDSGTDDADCVAADDPYDCCTGAGTGTCESDDKALTLLDAIGGNALTTPVRLDPGEIAYFEGFYDPSHVNSECPEDAAFSDTVTASGDDLITGESVDDTGSAMCNLCTGADCEDLPTPMF